MDILQQLLYRIRAELFIFIYMVAGPKSHDANALRVKVRDKLPHGRSSVRHLLEGTRMKGTGKTPAAVRHLSPRLADEIVQALASFVRRRQTEVKASVRAQAEIIGELCDRWDVTLGSKARISKH
ncbi:hypothetical protein [Cupriavidus sp. amp6]|uniref:hypothetical protein n=1 Tax=Cupriavidus sp. amp6 TaxID=388051 RepID=UPI0012EC0A00|nr:hypothetical protein [Cupriavidus sp. amp6]